MSFYKIENPVFRDKTIKEFLALKNRIRVRDSAEEMGKAKLQGNLNEVFKPITEQGRKLEEEKKNPQKLQISRDSCPSFSCSCFIH